MGDPFVKQPGWRRKFRDALRGMRRGVRGQSSFFVHFFMTAAVIAAAAVLEATYLEWCILLICITVVLTAEMLNTAIETLAKAVDLLENEYLRDALNIGSAAVLTAAIGAVIVGLTVFAHRLAMLLGPHFSL